MKPGIATTEFWLHNIAQLFVILSAVLGQTSPATAGTLSTVLASVYIIARSFVKIFGPVANVPDDTATDTTAPPAPTFKPIGLATLLIIALGVGILATTTGCPSTPTGTVTPAAAVLSADNLYVATANAFSVAAPLIDPATRAKLAAADNVAYAAIKALDKAAAGGAAPSTLQALTDAANAALLAYTAQLKAATNPTLIITAPATTRAGP